ncbi:hypothetical protein [Sedimenticola thiotaurini]|uniref:Thioredoxin-like fold domain-containing protein n=1 Tax=Sedimenticola thiotaurini TaxID=1543721 RepID=A0A0F7JZ64_9GAMM|nr:hypothetical protein [Sedimenticola thiotaurini]AKH20165.1 hypothetical protein AAY24_07125 [Sedimenticola thiotaurini]
MAFITMVKKLGRDGQPCAKCRDVEARMRREGLFEQIDRVVVAQEGDLDSEGMRLAQIYQVERAPFFLVADSNGDVQIYTVYFKLLREVLRPAETKRSIPPGPLFNPSLVN